MFSSLPDFREKETLNAGPSSCPAEVSVTYGFIILFNWEEGSTFFFYLSFGMIESSYIYFYKGVKNPFKLFARKSFSTQDIRDQTIECNLKDEFRIRALRPLKPLPGLKMSLFAKVEACK